jgi:hypothetical protein
MGFGWEMRVRRGCRLSPAVTAWSGCGSKVAHFNVMKAPTFLGGMLVSWRKICTIPLCTVALIRGRSPTSRGCRNWLLLNRWRTNINLEASKDVQSCDCECNFYLIMVIFLMYVEKHIPHVAHFFSWHPCHNKKDMMGNVNCFDLRAENFFFYNIFKTFKFFSLKIMYLSS